MKKLGMFCLLLVISLPAGAVEGEQVMYAGGTTPNLQAGALGRLDTTSETTLLFQSTGNKLVIPYSKIDSFSYDERVARHLGVLPAIVVALFKKRQQKHFFNISYHDENNLLQVAVFEVPKQMPETLLAVLRTRSPQGCKANYLTRCNQGY